MMSHNIGTCYLHSSWNYTWTRKCVFIALVIGDMKKTIKECSHILIPCILKPSQLWPKRLSTNFIYCHGGVRMYFLPHEIRPMLADWKYFFTQ